MKDKSLSRLHFDVTVIGAGPAGLMAAISAAQNGARVCLLERNPSFGTKLLLTGKGRCNLTNNRSVREIVTAFGSRGRFLFGALTRFSPEDLRDFFHQRGLSTKVERGRRVFPVTDRAQSVLDCLFKEIRKQKVTFFINSRLVKIVRDVSGWRLTAASGANFFTSALILATGGKSYPQTGSTGDGYSFAAQFGHQINPAKPSLAPLFIKDETVRSLAGLTLKNVRLTVKENGQSLVSAFGELLFTHQGLSGPVPFTLSLPAFEFLEKNKKLTASLDLKPVLDAQKLKKRIDREIELNPKKEIRSLLETLLPKSLIDPVLRNQTLDPHLKNADLTKKEKESLAFFLKNITFPLDGVAPLSAAMVTAGGVDPHQISPQTMGSKLTPGLFFAGEIIDLPGPSGGYNLQKAFSTGWVAGLSAAEFAKESPHATIT